jgi:cation diffusion facilitator family transporter
MAAAGSTRVIVIALLGNFAIAVTKFLAAAYTGSSAMLAEGVHSLVDTGNQALLLYGVKRSAKPADAEHPFGYGKELYFWAFVVAILLFSIGSGVSIYEGVGKIRHPHPIENPTVNYVVLLLAMGFEGFAWRAAFKEFNARRGREGIFAYLRRSKDAALFTVLFEDTGALLGLFLAIACLMAAQALDMPVLDGVASVGIGGLLAVAAVLLAIETKSLLIGEAADPKLRDGARAIVMANPTVDSVNELLTLHLGPDDVLLTLSVDFQDHRTAREVEEAISAMEREIKDTFPVVRRVFIEAQSLADHRAAAARHPGSAPEQSSEE